MTVDLTWEEMATTVATPPVLEDDAVEDDDEPENVWARRAAKFHAANPDVYDDLVAYALQLKRAGHERIGIELLWNRMRWDRMVDPTRTHGDYKLNQNFKAWYARRIMAREPELSGIFETRRLRAA